MPRYRVILEFDHPGDGGRDEHEGLTNAPHRWAWDRKLDPACSDITAYMYALDATALGTAHYERGRS